MSGGSHNYAYERLKDIAQDFRPKRNQDHFLERGEFEDILTICSEIAHDIEWIDSSDYGDEVWEDIIKNLERIKNL